MSVRVCQNSFSKGIISPSLQGRVDLEQYSLGVKNLVNGIVLQEGAISNRAGLEFLSQVKNSNKKVRLIPFVCKLNEAIVLEFGENYIRFIKNGTYILDSNDDIYEIQTSYSENDLFEIDYVQKDSTLTFVHKNYQPYELTRIQDDNWTFSAVVFGAKLSAPTNVRAVYTGSTSSNTTTYSYVVCAVEEETNEESEISSIATVTGHLEAYWTTSEYITISWSAVSNAVEYNIYRCVNGIYGYVGTSSTTSFKDNNIEPDLTSCAPINKNPFSNNNNPSCVCYFQQRKIYASSSTYPQTFWASQSGTNNNFNISRPLNATDAITLSLYDNVSNPIQHLIPFDDLLVMSSNSEWCVNGSEGAFCANPSPNASIQSYYGSSKIKPVISGSMVLFVQSGGNILRDLGYSYFSDSYDGEELTLFANHLFEGKQIKDMAYSKEPYRILWCIMDDGTINALTYNQKQKICAWHTHKTKGEFESVCTIREDNEDIPYFVVKRKINNQYVRYIERMKSRTVTSLDNAWFLDSSLKFSYNTKTSTITGLNHLIGETVIALADNGVVENLTVSASGEITLPYEVNNVLIGLGYDFELETLNFESQNTIGLNKIINSLQVKILNSREDFFVKNDDETIIQNPRCYESINYPKKLFTKDIDISLISNSKKQAGVSIIQSFPLPLTILSICAVISLEDIQS